MADNAESARETMEMACTIADEDDDQVRKTSSRVLERKRAAVVVAPPLPPLSVAYRVALDGAICAALVTHLVQFLLYFRGQIPW